MKEYIPAPLDLSHIEVPAELKPLIRQIGREVHETWAAGRYRQGWRYGEVRDDARKLHPDMRPFDELTEEEAVYDLETAMSTIKQLVALGYKIVPPDGH